MQADKIAALRDGGHSVLAHKYNDLAECPACVEAKHIENIPEFYLDSAAEHARHGDAMLRLGKLEGLRMAVAAIREDREHRQALRAWDGMNRAVAVVERLIAEAEGR